MGTDTGLLVSRLRALVAGAITVLDVDVQERDEPDRSYLLVQVRLSEPRGETWDLEEFYSLGNQAREIATELVTDQDFALGYVSGRPSPDEQPDAGAAPGGKRAAPQHA